MRSLILFLMISLFIACSKENNKYTVIETKHGKVIQNNVSTQTDTLRANVKEVLRIKLPDIGLQSFYLRVIDEEGNLYLTSYREGKIAILNKNGKVKKIFGGNGQGPGEIVNPEDIMLVGDSVFVSSVNSILVNKYDKNGDFIKSKNPNKSIAKEIEKLSNTLYAGKLKKYSKDEKGNFIEFQVGIFDPNFNKITKIGDNLITRWKRTDNLLKMTNIFAVNPQKEEVAIANLSNTKYEIKVYNSTGNIKYKLQRNYAEVPLSEKEIDTYFNHFKSMIKGLQKIDIKNNSRSLSINKIYYDKNGNLLVDYSSQKKSKNLLLDVFKDGVFQYKLLFDNLPSPIGPMDLSNLLSFKSDKIVKVDYYSSELVIYEYFYGNK